MKNLVCGPKGLYVIKTEKKVLNGHHAFGVEV